MSVDLVVIGLGYVGLPLVREAVAIGLGVIGYDLDEQVVAGLNAGGSHVDDVSDADVAAMVEYGFTATTDAGVLDETQTVVICVPTPLRDDGGPDLAAVTGAANTVAAHLRPGMLVILESTTYPGTTDEVIRPLLEKSGLAAGADFHLAFSPERIDPGNATYGLHNTPKIVGGTTSTCAAEAELFYGKFIDEVVVARGTREAEMAKLLENTYRHVNIALVNEMSVFCHELNIDLWNAIQCAATKPFGFQPFYPGPGVGGHCIPIDPNYLSYKVRTLGYPFRFVELAQEINQRMPTYVVQRANELLNHACKSINGSTVLLLGVTYKPNIGDERESPAGPVARKLRQLGADLVFHDPHVDEWSLGTQPVPRADDPYQAAAFADLTVLLQDHSAYDVDAISRHARLLFDTRGRVDNANAEVL